MSDNIPGVVLGTLARFRDLLGAAQNSKNESLRLFLPSKIDDELARFKVWSGNSGAHRSGRASLDYRLRDASGVRRQVLKLLDDLQEILEEALSFVTEQEASRDEIALDEGVPGGADVEKDMELVALDITDVVDCLLRLSVAIKNPAPHDRIKASGMEASVYEPFDIQHVRGKFGLLDDDLSQRLGRAISRRREFFKYREAHNKKLSYGLDLHQDTNNTEIVASTVASSIPGHMKEQANCCIQDEEDVHSVAGASQTSYATSVASNQTLRIPPMPADALRGPFQCPFCFMIVSIRDTAAWKKHVYDDLRPYNCLAKVCIASDQDFASRNDWMKHMLQYHLRIYRCPYECEETFGQAEDSRRHLEKAHPEVMPDNQVDELVNRSSRPLPPDTKVSCPFCLENLESLKQYRQHVGRHQQDLALFALPSTVFRDDDSEEDNAILHDDGDDSSSPGDDHQETAPDSDVSRRLARLYFMTSLNTFLHARGMTDEVYALGKGYIINGRFVDLYHLYLAVEAEGGYDEATMGYRWSAVASAVGLDCQNDDLMTLKSMYDRLLLEFERSEHHEPLSAARKQQHFSPSTSHQSELTESRSRFLQNLPNLTCPDCGARCKTESELKEHDKRHPKGYCGAPGCTRKEGFRTVDGLNRHLSSVHPGYFPGPRYRCTVGKCPTKDNTWFTPYDLQQHLEGVHGMLIPSFTNLKPFMYTSTSAEDTAPSNTVTTSNAEDQAQPPALSSPESDIKDWKQYIHIPYTVAEDSELAEMKKKLDKLFGEGNHHLEQTESKKLILNLTRQLTRIEIAELTTHLTGKGWGTDEGGFGAGQRTGHDACNPG